MNRLLDAVSMPVDDPAAMKVELADYPRFGEASTVPRERGDRRPISDSSP